MPSTRISCVWPPETRSATKGNSGAGSQSSGESRWPSRWWMPMAGMRSESASACANDAPTSSGPAADRAQQVAAERHQAPDVVARRKLGHHAAVRLVHGDLGVHPMSQQPAGGAVVKRYAGFVAGALDAEDQHAPILIQFRPFSG